MENFKRTIKLGQFGGLPHVEFDFSTRALTVLGPKFKQKSFQMNSITSHSKEISLTKGIKTQLYSNGNLIYEIDGIFSNEKEFESVLDKIINGEEIEEHDFPQKKVTSFKKTKLVATASFIVIAFGVFFSALKNGAGTERLPSDLVKNQSELVVNDGAALLKAEPFPSAKTLLSLSNNQRAVYLESNHPWAKIKLVKQNVVGWAHVSNLEVFVEKVPDKFVAMSVCERRVKSSLKSPSSADFAGIWDGVEPRMYKKDKSGYYHFVLDSWVDSQNSFGATVRTKFVCRVKTIDGDEWDYLEVKFLK